MDGSPPRDPLCDKAAELANMDELSYDPAP
jgi:hypothetical protein